MGWKTSCLLIDRSCTEGLSQLPDHEPALARSFLKKMGYQSVSSWLVSLDRGLTQEPNRFAIGAYNCGFILCNWAGIHDCIENEKAILLQKCFSIAPQASILAFEVASVVNYFAYALYEKGCCIRVHVGDADNGTVVSKGEWQPEEKLVNRESITSTSGVMGETLTFAMTQRFLGRPIDQFPTEKLNVELFPRKRPALPFMQYKGIF